MHSNLGFQWKRKRMPFLQVHFKHPTDGPASPAHGLTPAPDRLAFWGWDFAPRGSFGLCRAGPASFMLLPMPAKGCQLFAPTALGEAGRRLPLLGTLPAFVPPRRS